MQTVQKRKVDDLVYEQLLTNIRTGVWKSGEKIPPEPELCEILGVSRVTLRSAVQRLRSLGMVEVKQGKGTFVTAPDDTLAFSDFNTVLNLTEKEFNEITALREALEPVAIQLIMSQGDKADLKAIEIAYFAMKKALQDFDYEEYTRRDYQFHASIIIASKNDLFIQILSIFKDQYFKYFLELNKFLFEDNQASAEFMNNTLSPNDTHTLVYNYLMRKESFSPTALVATFTSGNKKNFARYLHEREKRMKENGENKA